MPSLSFAAKFQCDIESPPGEGGTVGPDLTVEGTRGRSDEWLVGHFKDPSAYTPGSVMLSFKQLTDEQLRALTVFLQGEKGPEPK